jgi:hypothetical protein
MSLGLTPSLLAPLRQPPSLDTGALLQVPVHPLRDGQREGRQATAIPPPWPPGQGHLIPDI